MESKEAQLHAELAEAYTELADAHSRASKSLRQGDFEKWRACLLSITAWHRTAMAWESALRDL